MTKEEYEKIIKEFIEKPPRKCEGCRVLNALIYSDFKEETT